MQNPIARIHPATGTDYRTPLYVSPSGRKFYPIGGASDDDEAAKAAAAAAAAEAAKAEAEKAAAEAAAKAEAEKLGYPPNTKAEDMTPEQQAAYYRHQARKHEDRNKEWQRTLDGKTAEEIKAEREELEKLRAKERTEAENAVEDAKKSTKAEVIKEFGTKLVAAEFKAVLSHVDEDRRGQIIENLDLSKFISDNGDVDTDKVKSAAAALAPADTGAGGNRDFGAGRRGLGSGNVGGQPAAGSIAARRAELAAAREAKNNTNV